MERGGFAVFGNPFLIDQPIFLDVRGGVDASRV